MSLVGFVLSLWLLLDIFYPISLIHTVREVFHVALGAVGVSIPCLGVPSIKDSAQSSPDVVFHLKGTYLLLGGQRTFCSRWSELGVNPQTTIKRSSHSATTPLYLGYTIKTFCF